MKTKTRIGGIALMLMIGAACLCTLGGCYERVVRAEGYGAERMDVYEPATKGEGSVYGGASKQPVTKSPPKKPVMKPSQY